MKSDKSSGTEMVSFETFKTLYDHQMDFCRKLRFFTKARLFLEDAGLAFDMIEDLLDQKEKELRELGTSSLKERKNVELSRESIETLVGQFLMRDENYRILMQIDEVRKNGGSRWEMLKSIVRGSYPEGPKSE